MTNAQTTQEAIDVVRVVDLARRLISPLQFPKVRPSEASYIHALRSAGQPSIWTLQLGRSTSCTKLSALAPVIFTSSNQL